MTDKKLKCSITVTELDDTEKYNLLAKSTRLIASYLQAVDDEN